MTDLCRRPIVRHDPTDMLDAERERMAEMRSRAAVPWECGDAIPSAPGRGAFLMFVPREMVKTEAGELRSRRSGYMGRNAIRALDAFDIMQANSTRARKARTDRGAPLFTNAQLTAGREYGALFEKHDGAGVKCSSVEASTGGGAGGAFIDAVLRDGQRLDRMRAAIGTGWALEPSRSVDGPYHRRAIPTADVVHLVCLGGLTVTQILKRFGWAHGLRNAQPVMTALCGALDRMYDADRR